MRRLLSYFMLFLLSMALVSTGHRSIEKSVQTEYQREQQIVDVFQDIQDQYQESQKKGQWKESLALIEEGFKIDPDNGLALFYVFSAIAHLPQDEWQEGFDLANQMVDARATTCYEAFVHIGQDYAEGYPELLEELKNQAVDCQNRVNEQ